MRITITEVCGPSRIYRSDGEKLREAILRLWSDAEVLEIDFEGVSVASISFLDEAIAVLAIDQPLEVLKRRLRLLNIVDGDRRWLNSRILARAGERAARGADGGDACCRNSGGVGS
ncbi:MAG: STAS-like domain-containing protein [Deltaproteobacteria bacterium]|nr:STAS-like domain-containing protein [Deltaproteobacteria bacterium]